VSRAVLSVGSNLGDRMAHLATAVEQLRPWLVARSPVYQTAPWGPVPQDDYLNAVLIVDDPSAQPKDWLVRAQAAEESAGRVRDVRWGPRTLDVDVVCVDGIRSDEPDLTLPHPRAAERAFVLLPWLTADPRAELAGTPVQTLVDRMSADELAGVQRRPDLSLG
jgi:2-amino-4-hydroxy-6-hydroxymethyldihydropteridine diphosphokinase